MAGPLAGLTGLYGPVVPHASTARDPANWGSPADKAHRTPGDSSGEHEVKGTQFPQDVTLLGQVPTGYQMGQVQDHTPETHAAPTVAGVGHAPEEYAAAASAIHGQDLGGTSHLHRAPTPYPVHLSAGISESPNQSMLSAPPQQLRSGSKDVDQGDGHTNTLREFQHGRRFYRTYTDPVLVDDALLEPRDRPFRALPPSRQNLLNGENSPYGEQGDFTTGMGFGGTPSTLPTAYAQPPNPGVAPTTTPAGAAPVSDYGWMAG